MLAWSSLCEIRFLGNYYRWFLQTRTWKTAVFLTAPRMAFPYQLLSQLKVLGSVFTPRGAGLSGKEVSGTQTQLLASAKPGPGLSRKPCTQPTGWLDWHYPTSGSHFPWLLAARSCITLWFFFFFFNLLARWCRFPFGHWVPWFWANWEEKHYLKHLRVRFARPSPKGHRTRVLSLSWHLSQHSDPVSSASTHTPSLPKWACTQNHQYSPGQGLMCPCSSSSWTCLSWEQALWLCSRRNGAHRC